MFQKGFTFNSFQVRKGFNKSGKGLSEIEKLEL
jgi:hypothetical protein